MSDELQRLVVDECRRFFVTLNEYVKMAQNLCDRYEERETVGMDEVFDDAVNDYTQREEK